MRLIVCVISRAANLAAICLGIMSLYSLSPLHAQQLAGWSLAISNDSIGEARDRWQSSSVQLGFLLSQVDITQELIDFGEVIELRLRTDILTPENLAMIVTTDRRYAGVIAIGAHSYVDWGLIEGRMGADVVTVGAHTGLYEFQQTLHEILGFTKPELKDFQIDDDVLLDFSGEISRNFQAGSGNMRPFLEAQIGSEDFLRIGLDVNWGLDLGREAMRATVTGHRVPSIYSNQTGLGFTLGGDIAWVDDSIYLPEKYGYELNVPRLRVRTGIRHVNRFWDTFYGLTWLNKEFKAQREGQFVGTFQFKLRF